MASGQYFALSQMGNYAVADCDSNGNLINKYCLLQTTLFSDNDTTVPLILCSCEQYAVHKARLLAINRRIEEENLSGFISKEKGMQCIHVRRLHSIDMFQDIAEGNLDPATLDNSDDEDDEVQGNGRHVDQLCASPLIIAAFSSPLGYGLLHKDRSGKARMRCSTCSTNVYACDHIVTYKQWVSRENAMADLDFNLAEEESQLTQTYSAISKAQIEFPLTEKLKKLFDEYEQQERSFPSKFVPSIVEDCCEHGFK